MDPDRDFTLEGQDAADLTLADLFRTRLFPEKYPMIPEDVRKQVELGILDVVSPSDDFENGRLMQFLLLWAHIVIDKMLEIRGKWFLQKFGRKFMENFEPNVFQLSKEDFREIDVCSEEIARPLLRRRIDELVAQNASFVVQRTDSLWHDLHFLEPSRLPVINFVSPRFQEMFGWTTEMVASHELNMSLLMHEEDLFSVFMDTCSHRLRLANRRWDDEHPVFVHPHVRRVLCGNGIFVPVRLEFTSVLDPLSRVQYFIVCMEPTGE
eukprot:TRINITY_DN2327_c0_g1_i1.p1 TRINITY_DN2327_c0_g1~~TRINITY_DN2327_c0_g1_i1.p1  ORF type:complete len:266 (-),score=62.34 TRINITY_DN2327_c0_g1_i1:23-820(-)